MVESIASDPGSVSTELHEEQASRGASSPATDRDREDGGDVEKSKSNVSIADSFSPLREVLFVATICLAQLMTQAGLGQLLAILHVVGDHFNVTNPGVLAWLIAGYSLTVGTFILISGRLGDLYGYKRMFLIGFFWFGVWELIAGLAVYSNVVLFIFARVLSGIGPSLALPNALAILGVTYNPGPRKNLVFALFGAVAPGGSVLGAAFAGLFNLAWWPWTFWSTAMTLFAVVICGSFTVPNDPRRVKKPHSFSSVARDIDVLGGTIGITALVLVNFAWNQASVTTWSAPYVYVLLIVGILLLPLFFYLEFNVAKYPLIPIDVLNADVGFVLGCVACGWGSFGIWVYYSWQFFEQLRQASPLLTAAYFSPVAITGATASITTAWLLGKIRAPWIMCIAMTAFTIGNILLATAPVGQTYWSQTFVMMLIIPFGMDMSFPASSLIISNNVAREHQGIGMSLVNTVVNYSISLALGIAGTVEMEMTKGLDTADPSVRLKGYRSALYFSTALAGSGLVLGIVFVVRSYRIGRT